MCIVISHTVQDVPLVEVVFWHDIGFPNHNSVVPLQVSLAVVVEVLVHTHTPHTYHGCHGHGQAFFLSVQLCCIGPLEPILESHQQLCGNTDNLLEWELIDANFVQGVDCCNICFSACILDFAF